jgi:hypothetical protein
LPGLNPIDESALSELIREILIEYDIRDDFPIDTFRNSRTFPGEMAHTEFPSPGSLLERAVIVYQVPVFREVFYHELAHLKLKCMGHPAFRPRGDMPPSVLYYYIMSEEYYARLLVDTLFPEVAASLMSEEVSKLQPLARYRVAAENVPRRMTMEWLDGFYDIIRMIQNERVCSVSSNLSEFRLAFTERIIMFAASPVSELIARIGGDFNELPALPNPLRRFNIEERNSMCRVTLRWVEAAVDDAFEILDPDTYSIRC